MRCLLIASLAAAAAAHSSSGAGRLRKSLGFGPVHPHSVYHSSPYSIVTNGFVPQGPYTDAFEVARLFVEDVLVGQLSETHSYRIRKDSYTDRNTGITHVYVRQLINGLEVADGDMNINIKDGLVISYGNSVRRLVYTITPADTSLVLPRRRSSALYQPRSRLHSSPPPGVLLPARVRDEDPH
ncbi:hypothetical protein BDZ89DRAFT_827216 [Hymenopellis radicata]|nr:hypothetical protein BDZ89DRAFT_827216 [Hymenopellis radicata]